MQLKLPNIVTFVRIALIPVFVFVFYSFGRTGHIIAAGTFMLAAISDWLDGYLARYLNQTTRFGEFLDPVADKLLVVVALILIVGNVGKIYVAIPAAIIVGREILISALREWMAEIGKRKRVEVSFIGKWKTASQMLALILLLLYYHPSEKLLLFFGTFFLYIAVVLTLWSMCIYIYAALPDLTIKSKK